MTSLLIEPARNWIVRQDAELKRRKGEKLRRQILRDLAWTEGLLADVTLSIWKWIRGKLEADGFEGSELTSYCQLVLEGIDGRLSGYEQLLLSAEEAGLTPEVAGLSELETKLPALREARPRVAEMLDFATRPPRQVDESLLNNSKEAIERGEFVSLDDEYLARLRAGQDF